MFRIMRFSCTQSPVPETIQIISGFVIVWASSSIHLSTQDAMGREHSIGDLSPEKNIKLNHILRR